MQPEGYTLITRKIFRSFYLFFICFFFIFIIGCISTGTNNTSAQKDSEAIADLKQKVQQQEALLKRMQKLAEDQIMLSNELEQSIPPQDLLESMQNGFAELRVNTSALEDKITKLEKNLTAVELKIKQIPKPETKHFDTLRKQENIILGLISLQAGNPDQALVYLQDILTHNDKTPLKAQILMSLGNGFLERGHATQAAYYYGIILREYTETSHVPNALYYLGKAMEELAETEKQKVLWNELIKNHPKSPLAKRAKKSLSSSVLLSD